MNDIDKIKKLYEWPSELEKIVNGNHNWGFDNGGKIAFKYLLEKINPKIILEIGSWMGMGSTNFFLKNSDAHLICIDHWSEDMTDFVSHKYPIEYVTRDQDLIKDLWYKFSTNVWDYKDRVTPLRKKSLDGLDILSNLDINIDLIYLDGDHSYQMVYDELTICKKNWPNALIFGDDYLWEDHSVKLAVQTYASENNLDIAVFYDRIWFLNTKKDLI